jgi:hypothetical protein
VVDASAALLSRKKGRNDARIGYQFIPAHDSLMNNHRSGAQLFNTTHDEEIIGEPGRPPVLDRKISHCIDTVSRFKRRTLINSSPRQHV